MIIDPNKQVYGMPTYDSLFKYVLDSNTTRASFFHAVIPQYGITESTRIDDSMNPLQEFQELRSLLHEGSTKSLFSSLKGKELSIYAKNEEKNRDEIHLKATSFLKSITPYVEDIQKAFPKAPYNGSMDFVCKAKDGDYVLVEMQVIPYEYWDKRALAYVAAFYGRQMKQGNKWGDIKRVIGINILGGGRHQETHWREEKDQFIRHYRFQEQLHTPARYIDGIEMIQYSLMNAPDTIEGNLELQEWMTFFKHAASMTEEEVCKKITFPSVQEAFQRCKFETMPDPILERYKMEEGQYVNYYGYTQELVDEGRAEGVLEGMMIGKEEGILEEKMKIAKRMSEKGNSDEMILEITELTPQQLQEIKKSLS